eukprot:5540100-Amphidinium_carterae.1
MTRVYADGNVSEYIYLLGATSASNCGCDRDTREDARGECIHCGEGEICGGMDDIRIQSGYYASSVAA